MEEKIPEEVGKTYSRIAALKMLFLVAIVCLVIFGLPNYWLWVAVPSALFLCYLLLKVGIQWLTYWVKTLSGK